MFPLLREVGDHVRSPIVGPIVELEVDFPKQISITQSIGNEEMMEKIYTRPHPHKCFV
jgi:hypothetical protein